MLGRRLVIVDLDTEFGCLAEQRLELVGDRAVIGPGEGGRRQHGGRRAGEKLADESQRDHERGERRPEYSQATLCAPRSPIVFGATHVDFCHFALNGRRFDGSGSAPWAQFVWDRSFRSFQASAETAQEPPAFGVGPFEERGVEENLVRIAGALDERDLTPAPTIGARATIDADDLQISIVKRAGCGRLTAIRFLDLANRGSLGRDPPGRDREGDGCDKEGETRKHKRRDPAIPTESSSLHSHVHRRRDYSLVALRCCGNMVPPAAPG